jgi:hypothetical protein
MVLAVVGGITAAVSGFARLFDDPPVAVTDATTIQAEAGDELALYRVGAGAPEGGCKVVGPDGRDAAQRPSVGTETLTLNGVQYVVDRVVTVHADGPQTVTCTSTGFAVGPRIGVFGLVGTVLAGVFGGIALFVVGLVLLIIGITKRRPAAPPPYPGQPPYPGPPSSPGQPPYPDQPPWATT